MTSCVAVSNACLLMMKQDSNGLVLFDLSSEHSQRRNIYWSNHQSGQIRDLCWAQTIDCFLILTDENLYTYSSRLNHFEQLSHSSLIIDDPWSITVLESDVYILSRSDTLHCYSLPLWTRTRSWSRTDLIDIKCSDQYIEQIRCNPSSNAIVLLIRFRRNRQWKIDFYDQTMKKLYSSECLRMASAYPTVRLHPYGQTGLWTLFNENYIWLIDNKGNFLLRQHRNRSNETNEYKEEQQ